MIQKAHAKYVQMEYCKSVLLKNGCLTDELAQKIHAGDIEVMRPIYEQELNRLSEQRYFDVEAVQMKRKIARLRELMDRLPEILESQT